MKKLLLLALFSFTFNSFALPLDLFPNSGAEPIFIETGIRSYKDKDDVFLSLGVKDHNMILRGVFSDGIGVEAGVYKSLSFDTYISVGIGSTEVNADVFLTIKDDSFIKEATDDVSYIWVEIAHDVFFVRVSRIDADFYVGESRIVGYKKKIPIYASDYQGFSDSFYLINAGFRFQ